MKAHIEIKDGRIRIDHRWLDLKDIPIETLIQYRESQYLFLEQVKGYPKQEQEIKALIDGLNQVIQLKESEAPGAVKSL